MKKIALRGKDGEGKFALVDDEDYEYLNQFKWSLNRYINRGIWSNGRSHCIHMHREILTPPKGKHTDHINRNVLDNRKENLRIATPAQNKQNSPKQKGTSSGYKGVYWNDSRKKWVVRICCRGKHFYLGGFKSKEKAAGVYDRAALKHHKEFACLNFPIETELDRILGGKL
jgi:hypothetical protein